MDDFQSKPPLDDDLSFLDELGRGLDPDPPEATGEPAVAEIHSVRPRRPLLELFPPSPDEHAATPPSHAPLRTPSSGPNPPMRESRRRTRPVAPCGRQTYEIFYGLNEQPFSLTPDPRFLYHSTSHDRAAHEILAAIERRDGIVIVTGEAGSGKTTLCRSVSDEIDPRTFTSLVLDSFVGIEELLKTVLIDFGVVTRADLAGGRLSEASEDELTNLLREFLLSLVRLEAFAVIFVDDAQNFAAEMLERVRRISDLERDKHLLQLVLVGEPSLLTRLGRPGVHQFDERVVMRCELAPLTEDEIGGYIAHRLAVSGGGPSRVEFETNAFTLIHEFSRGLPRLVNRICDRILALGYEQSASLIDVALVKAAAGDLDLIPPERASARALRVGVTAAALVGLMLMGAAAATFVFRGQVQRIVTGWQAIPPPPLAPPLRVVRPLEQISVPDDVSGVRQR